MMADVGERASAQPGRCAHPGLQLAVPDQRDGQAVRGVQDHALSDREGGAELPAGVVDTGDQWSDLRAE
jgi:hypothetical protein